MLTTVGLLLMSTLSQPVITPFAEGKKAAFSLEFDDSMDSQVKNALPLLAKYRIPATFYINPGRTNYRAEVWEKAVPAAGHELGDHTMHHKDTVGAEEGAKEIGGAALVIEKALGRRVLTPFGTPGGVKWEIPEADFRRILKENRLFFPGRQDFYMDDQGDILRFPKRALDEGVWRQLGFHGVGGEWLSTSVDRLEELLKFLDAHRGEMWIAPTGTIWKYQREREAMSGIEAKADPKGVIRLSMSFDRKKLEPFELYDVPLTVEMPVLASWKRAKVTVDGQPQTVTVREGQISFSALPQAKAITLQKGL